MSLLDDQLLEEEKESLHQQGVPTNEEMLLAQGSPTQDAQGNLKPISIEDQRSLAAEGGTTEIETPPSDANNAMHSERQKWQSMPPSPERDALEDQWYRTYWGKTLEQVREEEVVKGKEPWYSGIGDFSGGGFMYHPKGPGHFYSGPFRERMSAAGTGAVGAATNIIGSIPGLKFIDNAWDNATKFDDPFAQGLKQISEVVIPSMYGTNLIAAKLPGMTAGMGPLSKFLTGSGLFAAMEGGILLTSDYSTDDNLPTLASKYIPGLFGPKGWLPLPKAIQNNPGDSVAMTRFKNLVDVTVFSGLSSVAALGLRHYGKFKVLDWMEPLDDAAKTYKAKEIANVADSDKIQQIFDLQKRLAVEDLSEVDQKALMNEIDTIKGTLDSTDNIESALKNIEEGKNLQREDAAILKSTDEPDNVKFDGDKFPLADDASKARQTPTAGANAKNMGDAAVIKNTQGTTGSFGDPANIINPSVFTKYGGGVGASRNAVVGLANEYVGRFKFMSEGLKYTRKQMDAAAFTIYESIIASPDMENLKDIFMENRDVKNFLFGKLKIYYANEEQTKGAVRAIQEMVDRYFGIKVVQASGRAMDSVGREIASLSRGFFEVPDFIDPERTTQLITEKIEFLLDEWSLNKYVAGWSLRNKGWLENLAPENLEEAVRAVLEDFETAEKLFQSRNKEFGKTLLKLADENPLAMRPLFNAFMDTDGDVDSLAKLFKWSEKQITPWGLLKSPDPKKMNLTAQAVWNVNYTSLLSSPSAFNSGLTNTYSIIAKPINAISGAAIWGPTESFESLKRAATVYGAMYEHNRRALTYAWKRLKQAFNDPDSMLDGFRKDLVIKQDRNWDVLEDTRALWEAEGKFGKVKLYDFIKGYRDLGNNKWFRLPGITLMTFPDAFAQSNATSLVARIRAYNEVLANEGFADWKKIAKAEKIFYSKYFDKNNNPIDPAAKAIAGEINLNLPDDIAQYITEATTAYPILKHAWMFPRTQNNWIKSSASWLPITAIPGINRYSKTIYARTLDDKIAALAEHGIDYYTTPGADQIFQEYRNEYTARLMWAGMVYKGLWDYAMAGNIRGSGHYDKSRRQRERIENGYIPGMIKFPVPGGGEENDVWMDYTKFPGISQVLRILGDIAYYAGDLDEAFMESLGAKMTWTLSAMFLQDSLIGQFGPFVSIVNADTSGWARETAQMLRVYLPLNGAAYKVRKMIDAAQKDVENELLQYLMDKFPGTSFLLPNYTDFWTGTNINDIDNPWLRAFNAMSPIKVSATNEPWRVWLREIGYRGASKLTKDSTGLYEYSPTQRQLIHKLIGQQEPYKKIIKLMNSKKYKDQIGKLRSLRVLDGNQDPNSLQFKKELLPLYAEIDKILKVAQVKAELQLQLDPKYKDIGEDIRGQVRWEKIARSAIKRGDIEGFRKTREDHLNWTKLLKYANQ